MTITTDRVIENEAVQFERESFDRLERRRNVAERGAALTGGRLAFAAHIARRVRAAESA